MTAIWLIISFRIIPKHFNPIPDEVFWIKHRLRGQITDISLEYDIVTQSDLARTIKTEYDGMVLLYDRVYQHSQIPVNKSDTIWAWSLNDTCKSLKGILVLFEEEKPYA